MPDRLPTHGDGWEPLPSGADTRPPAEDTAFLAAGLLSWGTRPRVVR